MSHSVWGQDLLLDVFTEVFAFLDTRSKLRCRCVCVLWNRYAIAWNSEVSFWVFLSLANRNRITQGRALQASQLLSVPGSELTRLIRGPWARVARLDLRGVHVTDASVRLVCRYMKKLVSLNLHGLVTLSDRCLGGFAYCSALTELDLSYVSALTAKGLKGLCETKERKTPGMPALRVLRLDATAVDSEALAAVCATWPAMHALSIDACPDLQLHSDLIHVLQALPQLRELSFGRNHCMDYDGPVWYRPLMVAQEQEEQEEGRMFEPHTCLETLSLSHYEPQMEVEHVSFLQHLLSAVPGLRRLELVHMPCLWSSDVNAVLTSSNLSTQLTHLTLNGCKELNDEAFANCTLLFRQLTVLDLSGCRKVDDDALALLLADTTFATSSTMGDGDSLEGKEGKASGNDDDGSILPLETLRLAGCSITDASCELLSSRRLLRLRCLDLSNNKRITDAGVTQVLKRGLSQLEMLCLNDVSELTGAGFLRLLSELPGSLSSSSPGACAIDPDALPLRRTLSLQLLGSPIETKLAVELVDRVEAQRTLSARRQPEKHVGGPDCACMQPTAYYVDLDCDANQWGDIHSYAY
jgi:Leucine-rich repeat (LRR) protein